MTEFKNGLFTYSDNLIEQQKLKLPSSLQFDEPSSETILLRLLLGGVKLTYGNDTKAVSQNIDYSRLPFERSDRVTYLTLNGIFKVDDICEDSIVSICNKYFLKNRKNTYIHNQVLNELSMFIWEKDRSPMTAFVHLYRCLEFISYSFPMIYASKSKDYMGTFESLRKFLAGDASGELGFMKKFIKEIYNNNQILKYQFDITIQIDNIEKVREESRAVFGNDFTYNFEGNTFSLAFDQMMSFFITLRNRYFHFLVGQGRKNFTSTEYDMNELIRAFNPHFANWLAVIFCTIVQLGFEAQTS